MATEPLRAFRPHVSLNVANLSDAVKFYAALFGALPTKERPGYAKFELKNPPLNFSMNEHPHGASGSLSHLGFEVHSTEEVLNAKERLEKQGIVTMEELGTTCCYAKQDKVWVNDPDGNAWEIFVVTEKDTPNARGNDATGVCCAPELIKIGQVACC